ncbi:GNAT family N-acetyltransferase [Streptomyces viridochromogenes]|uniref:GNAT family N-acetyltransferase n=1 Tax=Streptomyces viridochromogenes TaxID=1938 RepID=UPI0015C50820|nr:GNAT family N-acetyltransferase [Streptomyces viridochromogenes]
MPTHSGVRAGPARVTTPVPRDVWWGVAAQDPHCRVTQTPTWLDCLCATGHHRDAGRLYEFGDGTRIVVPLAGRHRPGRLDATESWPAGWGIGGPVVQGDAGPEKARAVLHDLLRRPALRVGLRLRPGDGELWAAAAPAAFRVEPRTTQVVDLAGGIEAVRRGYHTQVRRDVRRAERTDVEVEVDRTGRLAPVFYGLYEKSIERWAGRQHEPLALARLRRRHDFPSSRLDTVAERFGESCAIWVAWYQGMPCASIVVLRHAGHAKYWRGAMDRELAHPCRANALLHHLAIEEACAAGCDRYDMGDSAPGSSLARYKANFGARSLATPLCFRERLPLSAAEHALRETAKRVIRFQDA